MAKKTFLFIGLLALILSVTLPSSLAADTSYEGSVVKLEGSDTLYYIASDGKRYVYPNEKIYKSWFIDFSDIVTISAEELAKYPLAGNISYRPGVVLVKIQTDPKVYAISKGGILRWIKTEKLAKKFYGENWAMLIDDLVASFFTNYTVGQDIDEENDYDADEEVNNTDTVEKNRGLALGHLSREKKAKTVRCRAIPAQPARPHEGKKTATPAISARVCKLNIINDNDEETDETAPIISNISVTASTSTATISWITNEESTTKVKYADKPLASATTTKVVIDSDLVINHSVGLTNLTASTTYYFVVKSADAASNIASSTERIFTTQATTTATTT